MGCHRRDITNETQENNDNGTHIKHKVSIDDGTRDPKFLFICTNIDFLDARQELCLKEKDLKLTK